MKPIKNLLLLQLLIFCALQNATAQQIQYNFATRSRNQQVSPFTDILVSSPVANQMLGSVTGLFASGASTNRYFEFVNGDYQLITVVNAATTPMVPGRGYVIQRGGLGVAPGDGIPNDCAQNYNAGGSTNATDVNVSIDGGMYNLLGNPFLGYLDADAFLLDPTNAGLITGPILLWAHNTLVSSENPADPNNPDTSTYTNTANDFALYNVLGGVAAGRYISTSTENLTFTGVQTPNGRIGFGTRFFVTGLASGTAVFKTDMSSTTDNGGGNQSFRGIIAGKKTLAEGENPAPTPNETSETLALPAKNRLWVNIEQGVPPTTGQNFNMLKQLLIGYIDGATIADNDRVYDAETLGYQPKIEFYSLAPASTASTKHLAIQGRDDSDFNKDDYFQLGYEVTTAGVYTFTAIGDGIFAPNSGKDYFIWDNGVLHEFPYTTTISGTELINNTRFRVVFGQKSLAIKLNIQGYYDATTHMMRPVKYNQGTSTNTTIADDITIELRDTPTNVAYSENTTLYTNGGVGISFENVPVGAYYIVVKHRNAIQTWSANPVQLVETLEYDFTTAASQAWGSNQVEVEPGVFALYSGDINLDESIDNSDTVSLFYDIINANFGDFDTDLNGDGGVDNSDLDNIFTNIENSIYSMHP